MMRRSRLMVTGGISVLVAGMALAVAFAQPPVQERSRAQQSPVEADIERTLGTVPTFMQNYPQAALPGAWAQMKALELSPDTALGGKHKELIGIAVAAQIPCDYCVYFHTRAAKLHGATDQEIEEAIAMAGVTRQWSTVINGSQIDKEQFRAETDGIMRHLQQQRRQSQR
jgi:AhpD family alkylhydroperoxidase